jgi:lysophospholipase L1-like esterase
MLSKTLLRMMFLCTVAINTAHAANPACISAESDPDGDGWGWENDRSCIVSTNSVEPEQNLRAGNGSGLPACQLSTSDPDGDGYGWENDSSCRVSGSTAAPAAETSGSSAAKPVCANAGSDPDGDGYGWENDRSCIVNGDSAITATTASSSGYSTPAETDQPDTDSASPLRFMAVGDSITHGVSRNSAKSYRHDLKTRLDNAGCRYTMVGSQQGNLGHRTFVSPHEGYNGHRTDHFLTGLNNYAGNNEGISIAVNRYQPDLVLLHLGTNDMLQNQNVADTVAEIDQIVSIILDAGADILLANVIPVYGYGAQTRTQQLGDQLQSYVAQLGNSRVKIVDVRSGFTNAMMLSDNLHPNPAGEAHIATAFFNAIQRAGRCRRF